MKRKIWVTQGILISNSHYKNHLSQKYLLNIYYKKLRIKISQEIMEKKGMQKRLKTKKKTLRQ